MGYHYKTTTSAAPFKLINSGETDDGYNLYYMQCPFTGKYLHSSRINKDGSNISLEWVDNQASATTYSFRQVAGKNTQFRIFPNTSDYGLTAWNSNAANYNIIPWDNNSDLGIWNLMDANGANEINEYELQVTDLNGDFSRTGGGTSDWKDKWDAKASLFSLQLTTTVNNSANRYDMYYSSSNLQMASSSDKTCYYTMTAPFGCVISGYRISGTTDGKLTLTKGDGSSTNYAQGATLTDVGESGILRKSTKFTLQGENKKITGSLFIKVKRLKTISSLSEINRNKCYAIDTKDRGNWASRPDYWYLTRNLATNLNIASDFGDTKQQFAFVYHDGSDDGVDNGSYYIYTVSTKKFAYADGTADNSVVRLTDRASQSISFVATGDSDYPVCIEMENTADLNVREDAWEAGVTVYGTNGSQKTDPGNKVRIYEVGNFDPTVAEDTWNTADITYTLYYNDTQIGDPVTVEDVTGGTAAVIPSSMDNGFMTYTYTPERVSSASPTVRIDATWNGPFDIYDSYSTSNHFYTISHNYSERANNYIWTYDGSSAIVPQTVATDAFGDINNNRLFCFVGDPYNGLTIYNKGAGSSKTVYSAGQNDAVVLSSTNTTSFIPTLAINNPSVSSNPSYFALKAEGTSYWLNWNQVILAGWTEADNGGTCWVLPEGKYYLNYLSSLNLVAPAGAVGTSDGITDEGVRTELIETEEALTEDLFYLDTKTPVEKVQFKTKLTGVKNGSTIALGEGYWRIVNADPRFVTEQSKMPAIYYNGTDNLQWSIDGLTADYQVKNIFKFAGSGTSYTIFSPNAQKYIKTSTQSGQGKGTGELGATGATVTLTSKGSSRYSLQVSGDAYVIHANGHNGGKNAGGGLVQYWNESSGSDPSGWYLVKVSYINISLNAGPEGDANYYATLCLPFDVTLDAACAYTLTLNGAHDGLTLSEAIAEIPAGTPVIIRYTKNTIKAAIASSAETSAPLTSTALTGVYVDTAVAADTDVDGAEDYFLGAAGEPETIGFYHWAGSTLKANRAYFEASGLSVKGFALNWDAVDAIESVLGSELEAQDTEIYSLAGQRLSKAQKGVNIINGKKVLVK